MLVKARAPPAIRESVNFSAINLLLLPAVNGSTAQRIATLNSLVQNATKNASSNGAFQLGQQVASNCILKSTIALKSYTGWSYSNTSGIYTTATGTDYLLRARELPFHSFKWNLLCYFPRTCHTVCSISWDTYWSSSAPTIWSLLRRTGDLSSFS